MIEAAFRHYLLSISAVTDIIGTRMSIMRLPQNVTLPAISYMIDNVWRVESQKGATGLVQTRMQIDHWASSMFAARELSEVTRKVLQGFRGTMGISPNVVKVSQIRFQSDLSFYHPDVNNFRVTHDYHIWHDESLPTVNTYS
jgi:hypothetical protein